MFDYAGSFHIHSSYSFDGSTNLDEIIAAAGASALDLIVVTDHFRMDARRDGWEGWHDDLLVLVGEEISPRHNHYLALGIETPVVAWMKSSRPQEYIDAVSRQGGIGLIAHPDHRGAPKFGVKEYSWQDWSVTGYTGISIWDFMTDWQEKLTGLLPAIAAFASPAGVLSGPKKETLERWDAMNARGRVTGYGEIDNHNSRKRFFGYEFRIFPFEKVFPTVRTHLLFPEKLSRDTARAKAQVMDALRAGRAYIAQERWRSAKGFSFRIYDDRSTAEIGGELMLAGNPVVYEIKLPAQGRIRLIRNGEQIAEKTGYHLMDNIDRPGVYRVEVHQKHRGTYKPWIFSNPVWVKSSNT